MTLPVPTERDEHQAVADALNASGVLWLHVPNEQPLMGALRRVLADSIGSARGNELAAKIGAVVGAMLNRMGRKKGFPDFIVFDPPPRYSGAPGVVIELKRRDGKRSDVSKEQAAWLDVLKDRRWIGAVAYGADDALDLLAKCGYLK